ncbi:hypothetical protein [Nocardia sp. CA-290969]|uniref:hypothetical protein n=1 Tax=Nocardia sp. CA-290969 TaxID=3239986 RepID=UPI003D8F0715
MSSPEIARIVHRPAAAPDDRQPLSAFYVEVESFDDAEGFGRRLREFVRAGVNASLVADFGLDAISEADIPPWTRESWESAAERYAAHRGDEEWTVQDVLFAFDPSQREWSWWDATSVFGNIVCVWVDSQGEAVYNCEELRWMMYVAGARAVVGPLLRDSGDWKQSVSLGTDGAALC